MAEDLVSEEGLKLGDIIIMYLGRRVKRVPVKKMPWNPAKQNVLVRATYFLSQSSLIEKKKLQLLQRTLLQQFR